MHSIYRLTVTAPTWSTREILHQLGERLLDGIAGAKFYNVGGLSVMVTVQILPAQLDQAILAALEVSATAEVMVKPAERLQISYAETPRAAQSVPA